jgi:hypothetical protein
VCSSPRSIFSCCGNSNSLHRGSAKVNSSKD